MIAVVSVATEWETRMQQWEYALSHFKPDKFYVDGPSDHWSPYAKVQPMPNLEDLPGELVLFAPLTGRYVQGTISLSEFKHPKDATYWFGSDSENVTLDRFTRKPDHIVYIPTDTNDQMYSWVAFSVAMWDRRMKG